MPDFSIEQKFNIPVIGLDEVGRGPLAGPVISCGCVFNNYKKNIEYSKFIVDSKKLSPKKFPTNPPLPLNESQNEFL